MNTPTARIVRQGAVGRRTSRTPGKTTGPNLIAANSSGGTSCIPQSITTKLKPQIVATRAARSESRVFTRQVTRQGRHLVDAAGRLLGDLEKVESGLHLRAGTVAGRLRIAAYSTAMRGLVAPRVRDLREAHPDLTLTPLSEREPWDTLDLVSSGQADVGVAHSWGDVHLAIPDHLVTTSLSDDVADVILHADHPLATWSRVTPHDLVAEGWIATPAGTICREWLGRM